MVEEQENPASLPSATISVLENHGGQKANGENVDHDENVTRGKSRHRKKALNAMILKQMEFYFSDANLSKDRFLYKLVETDPYVDLCVFLAFNKIRTLTQDPSRIAKALKGSNILALSEDGTKVCRTTPVSQKKNIDACVIYAEGLSADTDHDWLTNIFSRFGSVDYVSIPRYSNNKKIKGYAFIEFSNVEDANKCLSSFAEKNCTLPLQTAPHELLSIKTFSDDDQPSTDINHRRVGPKPITQIPESTKRSLDNGGGESESDDTGNVAKKPRLSEKKDDKEEMNTGTTAAAGQDDDQDEGKKKKKRKRKRLNRIEEQPDIEDFGLRIMAKSDWKQLRNKYLNLQREKMKQLKQDLKKTKMGQYSYSPRDIITEADGKKDMKNMPKESKPKFTFAEGLIIKIELDEPCTNPKGFKHEFRSDSSVQYIDIHDGTNIIYIRCDTAEGAKKFVEKHSEDRSMCILSGDEEKLYWDKMTRDRADKFEKKDRKETKQRGRDKLLKKAEKELGKHIRFDDV